MGDAIQRRGEWWYEQPDGSWLKWDEAAGAWAPQGAPPPPPGPGEQGPPPTPAQGGQMVQPQPGHAQQGPAPQHQQQVQLQQGQPQPHQPQPQQGETQQISAGTRQVPSYQPAPGGWAAPGMDPAKRLPADQLIVPETSVVSTQQRSAGAVLPPNEGDVQVRQVAPNVTQVQAPAGEQVPPPQEQVYRLAALRLNDAERAAAQQRLTVLAGCLAQGERLVGLTMGTEQVSGHAGLIAVTDRQILFVGQLDGSTQLFCPLEQVELVGYEDLGGTARLSVTAQGRVTTWRDIIPASRAAELSQLVENRGAQARAVDAPLTPQGQPAQSVSAGDVSVQHSQPQPQEIVIPESQQAPQQPYGQAPQGYQQPYPPYQPASQPEQKQDWKDKTKSFFKDLWNDPASRSESGSSSTASREPGWSSPYTPTNRKTTSELAKKLRVEAAGAVVVAFLSFFADSVLDSAGLVFIAWLLLAGSGALWGWGVYQRNGRVGDNVTKGISLGAIVLGGVSFLLALLWYF